jgi:hypothetical protein
VSGAIELLERMLAEQEPSSLGGSYARPRYGPAQYRIAELYRDRVGDKAKAIRAFHRVWTDHPTSLLRDDALWNAARLEREQGEPAAACATLRTLIQGVPDTRYAPCAHLLCPELRPSKSECHPYVVRTLATKTASDE